MRLLRPAAIIAAILIIAISIPPSLHSQTAQKQSQSTQPATRQRQPKRPQRADALAPAINELLKLDPIPPRSPGEGDEKGQSSDTAEEESKPPADNAPIKELITYWSQHRDANAPKPSDKVRQRLLDACEDRPELISGLVNFLPEATDTHDRLYKLLEEEPPNDFNWKDFLRNWLQLHSRYFRDDLIAAARGEAANGTSPGDNLRALARLDWEAARPIVEALALAGKTQMTPVALTLLYARAQQEDDSAQVEKYRALLKAIVVNRQSPHEARQTALSSLVSTEWNRQEDWVISLFADPTLGGWEKVADENDGGSKGESEKKSEKEAREVYIEETPNVLSSLLGVNLEKWLPVISNLVGHNQRTVHQSAVRCLTEILNHEWRDKEMKKEIAQKLAPWLTDPNWAAADDRSGFISSLDDVQAPELLTGLLWVLEHDEDQDNRAAAAEALTQYRDPRTSPALRRALEKEENEDRREKIVTALAECGGLSDDEMAAAIEAYAKVVVTEEGEQEIDQAKIDGSEKPLPLKVSIGRILSESQTIQATEGMVVRLIERAKALRATQPVVARKILSVMEGVPLRAAEINLVERIGDGWADVDALKLALENRDSLQKSATSEIYNLIKQGGYPTGVAAAILNDDREHRETLKGTDAKAQLALLAGARYLRDRLPIELVSKLLDSSNRALAKAVESYLEIEDSAEARKLVLARRRGEAYILGDITAGGYPSYINSARNWEEEMRKEIKDAPGMEAIYALARPASVENFNGIIIRVRDGKAEISIYEIEGRKEVRLLTLSEFEELKGFASRQGVEDLGPESYDDSVGRMKYEYLRLTKDGGRRIILDGLRRAPKNPTLHEELSGLFHRLSRSGEFVTRYAIEDKIPGVEVLLADKKHEAIMVLGEGREIRVLMGEKEAEYKRGLTEAMPEWREFSSGKPGKVTDDPAACRVLNMYPSFMKIWRGQVYGVISLATRSGKAWFYGSFGDDPGVWKLEPGAEPAKIISGSYIHPVVTPDGKWLVAIKTMNEGGEYSSQLVRHNLQTGKEFQIDMANGGYHPPIMYVAAHSKVLLGRAGHHGGLMLGPINYLVDAETGTLQMAKGEFRPLMDRYACELQPTGNLNEYWAAVHDWNRRATKFGRYDIKNFVFTPLVELPELILRNSDFWVDANAGKIWLTYRGHLLRIPLPQ
jgi:hypothetical protein